jgi:hypothetical protein
MANTLLTVDEITAESLNIVHNEMSFVSTIDKQHDKTSVIAGQKRGASIRIRKPARYSVRTGWTFSGQDMVEEYDTLTVGTVKGVDLIFTDAELALSLTDFSRQVIKPAVSRLAEEIELLTLENMVKATYNQEGTPGTTPATALVYLNAGSKMTRFGAPRKDGNRHVQIDAAAEAATVNGLATLFHARTEIEKQFTSARMGHALGLDFHANELLPSLTTGTRAGTTLVDGAVSVEGATTIHIDGFTGATDTVKKGEIFTVAGVFGVNPITKKVMPTLQQFVVTADATAGTNEVTLSVSPAIYTSASGGRQSVSAFPADNAAVTFAGAASTVYPLNLAYHKEAYTFATALLEMPNDVDFKAQKEMDGINIRILRQYDISEAQYNCRLDVFFGHLAQRPEHACRIIG